MPETSHREPRVKRRPMDEADIEAVATLLSAGFPQRGRAAWLAGLERQRTRIVPEGRPRFGLLIETGDRPVGIILTIYAEVEDAGGPYMRCHFSSWYVEPAFRAYSALLVSHLLKDQTVTYVNISPAPHTGEIIAAQGFEGFGTGWRLTLPWLHAARETARAARFDRGTALANAGERALLEQHDAFGCLCMVVEATDGLYPFVFTARRRIGRLVAATYLVYCRDLEDYVRFAGLLGRALLRHGILTVIVDSGSATDAVRGRPISRTQNKYFRGPSRPRPGDYAFSELVIFGP